MADLLPGVTHPAVAFPVDLRAVLGMPPDALLVHLTIENVGEYIKRLDGCQWLLIGALFPYQTKNPTYPALLLDEDNPSVVLQIWLWRVFNPSLPVYGELRWDPSTGSGCRLADSLRPLVMTMSLSCAGGYRQRGER
jgi:hypothetical protein